MTSVDYRILTPDDGAAWRNIRLEALENDPEAFGASVEAHHKLTDDEIRSRLALDMAERFVIGAFADGELIGTAGFVREPGLKERHKGRVWGVYLRASHRGSGAGRQDDDIVAGARAQDRRVGADQHQRRCDPSGRDGVISVSRVCFVWLRTSWIEGQWAVYRRRASGVAARPMMSPLTRLLPFRFAWHQGLAPRAHFIPPLRGCLVSEIQNPHELTQISRVKSAFQ